MFDPSDPLGLLRFEHRRTVTDEEGTSWQVREVPNVYDRRGGTSLIFECDAGFRRVRAFPRNWYELPDAELWALSRLL